MISDVLDFSGSSLGDPGASRIIRLIALGIILHTLYNILYNLVIYPFYTSPLRHLPGPKVYQHRNVNNIPANISKDNFSIFGQGFKLLRAPWVPHLYRDWAAQDPDSPFVRFLGVGSSETLVATSIDAYREILQTENDSFVKPELTRKIANTVVGDGLPFAYGHCHRQRKAALTSTYSPRMQTMQMLTRIN